MNKPLMKWLALLCCCSSALAQTAPDAGHRAQAAHASLPQDAAPAPHVLAASAPPCN